jgi:RNA polymerase sigma-70 factor, ECF subfamily
MSERDLIAAATRGDEDAFGRLVAPYRRELHAHAYRMLGSAADAEDALQDALLGAWRGLARFQGRSSLRSWLYTITTNASLKAISRRPKRVLPIDYGPPSEPHDRLGEPLVETAWVEPYPDDVEDHTQAPEARYDQRESVELAFVAALQHLPPRQRAALILRDVLGFSARETAETLDTTPISIDSALQRAHKTVGQRMPDQSQQVTLRSLGDDRLRELVEGYVDAWERADVDALAAMLAEDAAFAMPPQALWFRGRDAIAAFLALRPLHGGNRWRVVPTRANSQPAFGHYIWDDDEHAFVAEGIGVLTLVGDQISELTVFREAELFERFGLPDRVS